MSKKQAEAEAWDRISYIFNPPTGTPQRKKVTNNHNRHSTTGQPKGQPKKANSDLDVLLKNMSPPGMSRSSKPKTRSTSSKTGGAKKTMFSSSQTIKTDDLSSTTNHSNTSATDDFSTTKQSTTTESTEDDEFAECRHNMASILPKHISEINASKDVSKCSEKVDDVDAFNSAVDKTLSDIFESSVSVGAGTKKEPPEEVGGLKDIAVDGDSDNVNKKAMNVNVNTDDFDDEDDLVDDYLSPMENDMVSARLSDASMLMDSKLLVDKEKINGKFFSGKAGNAGTSCEATMDNEGNLTFKKEKSNTKRKVEWSPPLTRYKAKGDTGNRVVNGFKDLRRRLSGTGAKKKT
jgi:hypothetical protein